MSKILKSEIWYYHDGPVRIITESGDDNDYVVETKFNDEELKRGGFLSHKDAFGYGLTWVLQQVGLLTDRLRTIHETEIMND